MKIIHPIITLALLFTAIHTPAQNNTGTKQGPSLREFSHEVPAPEGSVFRIINTLYNLELRTWDEKKVRIVTTISLAAVRDSFNNDALYALSNINLKTFGKLVELESIANPGYPALNHLDEVVVTGYSSKKSTANIKTDKSANGVDEIVVKGYRIRRDSVTKPTGEPIILQGYPSAEAARQAGKKQAAGNKTFPGGGPGIEVSGYGNQAGTRLTEVYVTANDALSSNSWTRTANSKRKMIVYIPKDCQLLVHNRNTDIMVNDDLDNADFNIATTNLGTRNIRHLKVDAKLFTIYTGDLGKADLKLASGSFISGTIANADIRSSQSEIDYDGGDSLLLKSQSDRINLEEIGTLSGTKNFGNLRIGKLSGSVDLEGRNSNVKIRRISPEVSRVRISTQYADLRLPLRQLNGFKVEFEGDNSAVYSAFRPVPISSDGKPIAATGTEILNNKTPSSFTVETGSGKLTSVVISCPNCTVDFK